MFDISKLTTDEIACIGYIVAVYCQQLERMDELTDSDVIFVENLERAAFKIKNYLDSLETIQ